MTIKATRPIHYRNIIIEHSVIKDIHVLKLLKSCICNPGIIIKCLCKQKGNDEVTYALCHTQAAS